MVQINLTEAQKQINVLSEIEMALRSSPDLREKVNNTMFSVSNKLGIHPHDLAIYILIRTTRL